MKTPDWLNARRGRLARALPRDVDGVDRMAERLARLRGRAEKQHWSTTPALSRSVAEVVAWFETMELIFGALPRCAQGHFEVVERARTPHGSIEGTRCLWCEQEGRDAA